METVTLILAVLGLLLAFTARRKASRLEDQLSTTRREMLTRQADDEDLGGELSTLRRQVELLAKGHPLDPLMVREKRLYASVQTRLLEQQLDDGSPVTVIDVRTAGEWGGGHIPSALHLPLDQLEQRLSEVPRDGTPIFCICAGGGRSQGAAEFLSRRGFLNVHNVEGGMNSWRGPAVQD